MGSVGGYSEEKLAWRAAKRGRTVDEQAARDSRSSAQKLRDRTGRAYIAPPEEKPKMTKSVPVVAGKKKR